MRRYIVKSHRGHSGSPEYHDEYLAALRYDPYQKGGSDRSHSTSTVQAEAFKFRTRAAAEMAAVFVGGRVVKLTKKATRGKA